MITDEMVKRAATEYLSHKGERPYRVTRRGAELWEDHAPAIRAALEAALSAAEPQPAPSVAVKELEWSPRNDQPQYEVCADTPFGRYKTSNKGEYGFGWMQPRQTVWSGFLPTLEEAKAAAQSHYESRIRSALSAQVQEVAGWQPIENAPKDGRTILAYFPLEGLGKDWERVMPVKYRESMMPEPWIFAGRAASSYSTGPTHWMPLPSAPAAPAKQEG